MANPVACQNDMVVKDFITNVGYMGGHKTDDASDPTRIFNGFIYSWAVNNAVTEE
jgi:hypothetical protein